MPRRARIVIPYTAHHITQRGNYQQTIFDKESDYKQYCEWIDKYAQETGLDILAYCLMKNHVHFIVVPKQENDISAVFKTAHMRYSHYINRQRSAKGHLWQGRFYSCILDDAHLYRAIRYVENNPIRAKMVKCAWDYEYSSAKDHAGGRDEPVIKLIEHKDIEYGKQWQAYLREDDPQMTQEIRLKTSRGLVIGSDKFISKIEALMNRSLKCLGQGRPRKNA